MGHESEEEAVVGAGRVDTCIIRGAGGRLDGDGERVAVLGASGAAGRGSGRVGHETGGEERRVLGEHGGGEMREK